MRTLGSHRLKLVAAATWLASIFATPVFAQPQTVTFQQVLDYLRLDVKEEKILKVLQDSPAVFTLGADQITQLKSAGASQRLIDAIQKRGANVSSDGSSDIGDFILILDCSGSMRGDAEPGVSKFAAAQKAAVTLVRSIPENRNFALIVYGNDVAKRCTSIEMLRALGPLTEDGKDDIKQTIAELKPTGDTPIASSLEMAADVLKSTRSLAKVIVITDGMETCGGDPVDMASKLAAMPHVRGGVDVIGFGLKPEEVAAVGRIAKAGKGEFYNADTVARLSESVEKVSESIQKSKLNETDETGLSALDRLLIKQLADKDVNVRGKAAQSLGERKVAGAKQALATLIGNEMWDYGALFDRSTRNTETDGSKDAALTALLGIDRPAAESALATALNSPNGEVSAWAAFRIGEHRLKGATPALAKLIASDRWQPHGAFIGFMNQKTFMLDAAKVLAVNSLKTLDRNATEEALLKAAESTNEGVRAWATETLSKLASEGK